MAVKQWEPVSLILIAAATILITSQTTTAADLCADASYKPLCRSLVRKIRDPNLAAVAIIHNLFVQTNHAKFAARRLQRNQMVDTCMENYDSALDSLNKSLAFIRTHDKPSVLTFVSAALTSYSTCDDAYDEMGEVSPLSKANALMQHTAASCLDVYNHVH